MKKVVYILAGVIALGVIGNLLNPRKKEVKKEEAEKVSKKNYRPKFFDLDGKYYDENDKEIKPTENDITYRVVEILNHVKNEGREEKFNNEVISLLIEVNKIDEISMKDIIFDIKNKYAKFAPDNCLIELWDNKKAYDLMIARDKYAGKTFDDLMAKYKATGKPIGDEHQKLKDKWDKENYVFIADHNIATLMEGSIFKYYMLRDSHYAEMKK
ncbi:hypothetical protein V3471_08705 [Flavobacterium oreochromis]|uniref:hypothetical protein n=1 Tax=Flavobacterium oreochromis TaxID=2906078 RepID=UPI003859B94E